MAYPFAFPGFPGRMAILALTTLLFFVAPPRLFAGGASPFDTLLGTWRGSGMINLKDGTRERLQCNGYYTGGGSQLRLAILCSSPDHKIEMRGKMSYSAGRLSGSWEERTYNAKGSIKGRATKNRITMTIGGNVTGSMTVSYSKTRQTVEIKTRDIALKNAKINLSRR